MQPIPKGDNLVEALKEINVVIGELIQMVADNNGKIRSVTSAFQNHFHDATPGFGGPSTPSTMAASFATMVQTRRGNSIAQYQLLRKKIGPLYTQNYLTKNSPVLVNSRFVFTT